MGVLVAAIGVAAVTAACGREEPRRSVLLVVLDTVRADHLSAYGYERATSPDLDRLAEEGELYTNAWSQSPWTLPSVATILTGLPPHLHGAERTGEGLFGVLEDVPTLAEWLQQLGWRTAAVTNVVWLHPRSGLARGFDSYDHRETDETNRGHRDARTTTDAALDWLRALDERESFFLMVHYFDAHLAYDPPAPYDTMFGDGGASAIPEGFGSAAEVFAIRDGRRRLDDRERASLISRYDGEIRFAGDELGRLRREMEALGVWDETLVIVAGDHGEEFWDHGGFEHGHSHHRELLRVPLIVRDPGGPRGAVRDGRVRLLDIAPRVLEFARVGGAQVLPGRALGAGAAPAAVAEGSLWAGDVVSVRSDDGIVMLDRGRRTAVYYAPDDPLEERPQPPTSDRARALLTLLQALPPGSVRAGEAWDPTEQQLQRLRSLGYAR